MRTSRSLKGSSASSSCFQLRYYTATLAFFRIYIYIRNTIYIYIWLAKSERDGTCRWRSAFRHRRRQKAKRYSPIEARLGRGVLLQPADLKEMFVPSAFVATATRTVPNFGIGFLITVIDLLVVLAFHCCAYNESRVIKLTNHRELSSFSESDRPRSTRQTLLNLSYFSRQNISLVDGRALNADWF